MPANPRPTIRQLQPLSEAPRLTTRVSLARDEDGEAVRRLARLEGSPAPAGPVVLADVDGEPVAAIGLADGATVADPARAGGPILTVLRLRRWEIRVIGSVTGF